MLLFSFLHKKNNLTGYLAYSVRYLFYFFFSFFLIVCLFFVQSGRLCKITTAICSVRWYLLLLLLSLLQFLLLFFVLILLNYKSVIFLWRSFICQRLPVNSNSLTHSLCLRDSVSNFFFSLSLCVCMCVRACACTVVYFTVLCEQRHLLYEQFQLHRIL